MSKLLKFFKFLSNNVVGVLSLLSAILFYLLNLKSKENNSLVAKIELAKTQKEIDNIELEIKQKMKDNSLLKEELDSLQNLLKVLQKKRKELKSNQSSLSDSEAEKYWNE